MNWAQAASLLQRGYNLKNCTCGWNWRVYGRVKREIKASSLGDDVRPFIPFLYQGQYYDFETNLAYNRFRYYSPETEAYISQDPIGLGSGEINFYSYVINLNDEVDILGLSSCSRKIRKIANREARRLREEGSNVRVITVIAHKKTGKIFIGHSGTNPSKINSRLKNHLPKYTNIEDKRWAVTNCAEVDAFNQGMNKMKGSKIEDFESYTIQVNNSMEKPACANCSI